MMQIEKQIEDLMEKSLKGERLEKEEAYELAVSGSIFNLGRAADELRKKRCGDYVSYVVNRNINFTNICVGSCRFCAYRVKKGSEKGYLLNTSSILSKAKEAYLSGATELCMQGGLHPDIDINYYLGVLKAVKAAFNVHIHAFSPMEVFYMADKSGWGVMETLKALKESGLDSMPGTAGEIFDKEVREMICPEKINSEQWVYIVKTAHRLGIKTTATMLYGHVERPEHRINHMNVLRRIQDETGGFTEFVPLSFIHYSTPLKKQNPGVQGASGLDDLMVHALARLFLDNFDNIQASWVKLGKKLSQIALHFGANDLGGTLMEESISSSAGQKVEVMDEVQIRALIEASGRIPKRRDTLYNPVG